MVQVSIVAPAWGLRELACEVIAPSEVMSRTWLVDGRDTTCTDEILPTSALRPGDAWTCRATVDAPGGELTGIRAPFVVPAPIGGNVLVVVLDDVGIDEIASYGAHPADGGQGRPRTPTGTDDQPVPPEPS